MTTPLERAAEEYADEKTNIPTLEFVMELEKAFKAGAEWAITRVLEGIAREQSYREFRDDQDGSGVGTCKEIASYCRAILGKEIR